MNNERTKVPIVINTVGTFVMENMHLLGTCRNVYIDNLYRGGVKYKVLTWGGCQHAER